jgi:hypothetical protein
MLAPICLFTYNRPYETKLTIEALKKNDLCPESELFIFSDGPKNYQSISLVNEVRDYIHSVTGFKNISIIESDKNKGLANSIINGVNQVIKKYGKVIVLEDDLITTPAFLAFMNQALNYYKSDKNIQSINGFSLQVRRNKNNSAIYFQKRPFSWGWATWADRWSLNMFNKNILRNEISSNSTILKKFKNECGDDIAKMLMNSIVNKNDSWYVRWAYNHFKTNKYSVYPYFSLVENIGFSKEGTHCKTINPYKYKIENHDKSKFELIPFRKPTQKESRSFLKYFTYYHKLMIRVKLIGTPSGRRQLLTELKTKFNI